MSNIPPETQKRCKYPPTNDLSVLALESDEEDDGSPETNHICKNDENHDQEKACAPENVSQIAQFYNGFCWQEKRLY